MVQVEPLASQTETAFENQVSLTGTLQVLSP